ncbi:AraC family transcriptional regulator [Nitratireductor sp. XY-223]|uniref:AraC family transcriptional regulator n=1 Tax=Nitratireductor sp. XY-223 TaxID=2561926 RepID=UPI0010A9CB08|nr:AraC family transcriptional regulator [Nitratireductor sp. XY-223]
MTTERPQSTFEHRAAAPGVDRARAFFRDIAFSPHRHDTYAVGYTTRGVQTFRYRGKGRYSLPGDVFVLHPDEVHDGRQGDDRGYGYRIAYIDPQRISEALGDGSLPFVDLAACKRAELVDAIGGFFPDTAENGDPLFEAGALTRLADAMHACSARLPYAKVDRPAMRRVRDHLLELAPRSVSMTELEVVHGFDRFSLARQFRRAFGVSPHRFVTLRRLDIAMGHIRDGKSLADAALLSCFADQSHMTRQFRGAFGLSPGRWRTLQSPAG